MSSSRLTCSTTQSTDWSKHGEAPFPTTGFVVNVLPCSHAWPVATTETNPPPWTATCTMGEVTEATLFAGTCEWEGRRRAVVGIRMQGRPSEAITAGAGTLPTIDMPAGRHHLS